MAIRHYFTFIEPQFGRLEIGEPDGFDKNGFVIKQRSDGYGRDISYAGGKSGFRIWAKSQNEYHFDKVLAVWRVHGYNGIILYEIDFNETTEVIGQLDLADTFKTDTVTYIDFNVIENTNVDLFKKRFDTNVNLLATETLDGVPITPVQTYKMLYNAVPAIKVSDWKVPSPQQLVVVAGVGGEGGSIVRYFNYANVTQRFNIKNSLGFLQGSGPIRQFGYIEAQEDYRNITLKLSNVNVSVQGNGDGKANFTIHYHIGNDASANDPLSSKPNIDSRSVTDDGFAEIVDGNYVINIAALNRTQKLYIYIGTLTTVQNNSTTFGAVYTQSTFDVEIIATEQAYSTVIDVVRLVDAMRYTALSAGNNPILAPRWDAGGEFYNQFITTANMMRGLLDRPFNITNKFLADKYLPEVNGDYELQKDGKVFYGIYRDFYRNVECGVFDMGSFDFSLTTNPLYACNELSLKFDAFQSQRETEKDNTNDIVHGESAWLYPNKGAQNKKEVSIGVVRDPFLTDEVRINGYVVSDNTATNDDSKIFAIEGLVLQEPEKITTTTFLQHTVNGDRLVLANQGEISWKLLGIVPGSTFFIYLESPNGGIYYTVEEISGNTITLYAQPFSQPYTPVGNDGVSTRYMYEAKADYINRTTEGFTIIDGITNSENFGNLPWTIKRILVSYYNEFNASNLLYANGQLIKNTLYNNNPDLITQIEGGAIIREGDSFTATGAILSTQLANCTIVGSLLQWLNAQEKIRLERGFLRIMQPNGLPMKVYLKEGEFLAETAAIYAESDYFGSAKITGEVKYEPMLMNIFGIRGDITINGEITPSGYTFKIDGIGKLSIFDSTGRLLHIPVLYNNVSVNGIIATSKNQLGEWMAELTPEWDAL